RYLPSALRLSPQPARRPSKLLTVDCHHAIPTSSPDMEPKQTEINSFEEDMGPPCLTVPVYFCGGHMRRWDAARTSNQTTASSIRRRIRRLCMCIEVACMTRTW